MLLTLSASSLHSRLTAHGRGKPEMDLTDVPRYARDQLDLYGLTVQTKYLVGADAARLEHIRDAADKAQCPCLVLVESEPQALASAKDAEGDAAMERVRRVVQAASRLGCNSVVVSMTGVDDEDTFEFTVERMKRVLASAERLEINVLLAVHEGPSAEPERLTKLIKEVGGFRIGAFPDFERAARADDPIAFLKRVVPYASALNASSVAFEEADNELGFVHSAYDIEAMVEATRAIGYQNTMAIEYRGEGEPELGIERTRDMLVAALERELA